MPNRTSIIAGFRGTAEEVGALANTVTDNTHYQPTTFTKKQMKRGFELLLLHQSSDLKIDPWSIRRVAEATDINISTIREMRIALIMLGLLPYRADMFSKKHVREMWSVLNDPANADKSHEAIATEKNWRVSTVRYYARVGRFVGAVQFRDIIKSTPTSAFSDVRVALLGKDALQSDIQLQPELFDKLSTMLVRYTDEDGYIEDRSIKKIATCLEIPRSIVAAVRVGLVTLGKLPEQKLFDKTTMLAMWDALEGHKTSTELELSHKNGWDHETFLRAARIGRLAGKVSSRVIHQKAEWLPQLLDYMRTHKVRPSKAAAELGIDKSLARTWMRKRGAGQKKRIESYLRMLTDIVTQPSGSDLTNEQLAKKLNVSAGSIGTYLHKIIERLTASEKPEDIVKLEALQPRIERIKAAQARKAVTRAKKAAAKPNDP